MQKQEKLSLSSTILKKGKELGADLVGIASPEKTRNSPSSQLAPHLPAIKVGLGNGTKEAGLETWPAMAKSLIVIGLSHPEDKPEMDWWYGEGSPPGNKKLIRIIKELNSWLNTRYPGIETFHPPYHVENGGIFLKDAAVWGGLGTIGKNNLLITPDFGPRIRLRSLILNINLPPTGPVEYNPCSGCGEYCLEGCPQEAFSEIIFSQEKTGLLKLPGKIGNYSRLKCHDEMEKALENSGNGQKEICKFCRVCEFNCPVGK